MILSIVGNILFLIFIIVGCVGTHKKATQSNAEGNNPIFTLRNTEWKLNDLIDTTPQGYQVDINNRFLTENYMLTFTDIDTTYLGLRFEQYRSIFQISYFEANQYGGYDAVLVYSSLSGWSDTDYIDISIANLYDPNKDYDNRFLIDWFNNNGVMLNSDFTTFTFNTQINYNAPINGTLNSPFVNQVGNGDTAYTKIYDLPLFESNGQLFDRIKLWYINALSMRYIDSNSGNIYACTRQDLMYYSYMEYINTTTEETIAVNFRNFYIGNDPSASNSVQTALDNGSNWVNTDYRVLKFQNPFDNDQRNSLAQFNNDTNLNGLTPTSSNVGLGNVFTLMGSAFSGLSGLLAIQILPNITIGLLLFIPLIVMIILAVIWIVKR